MGDFGDGFNYQAKGTCTEKTPDGKYGAEENTAHFTCILKLTSAPDTGEVSVVAIKDNIIELNP